MLVCGYDHLHGSPGIIMLQLKLAKHNYKKKKQQLLSDNKWYESLEQHVEVVPE